MNVTEKELWKSSEADSSSSVRHRKVRIALLVIAVVLIAALAAAWFMFGTQLTAAMTIKKLDEGLWSIKDAGHNSNTDQPETVNRPIEKLAQRTKCWET